MTFLYNGKVIRKYSDMSEFPLAFDCYGNEKTYKEYVIASSKEKALSLIKYRLRKRYGINDSSKIILDENAMHLVKY